jgi:hypothetical protein
MTSYRSCVVNKRWCEQNLDGVNKIFKSVINIFMVVPLNNFMGPEGDTVTVAEQLLNTEYWCEQNYDGVILKIDGVNKI